MIPCVQFPDRGRVHRAHEIHRRHQLAVRAGNVVRHVHDVFVRTDAVERRHLVARQHRLRLHEPPTAVRRAAHRALLFRPAQRAEPERGPVRDGIAARIHLLAQQQQAKVAALVRTEAAHFHVVADEIRPLRNGVLLAGEELLLEIEARPPREVRTDLQVLTLAMARHVRRKHALARIRVMFAARGVDVVVAAPPAGLRGIDPALHLKRNLPRAGVHADGACLDNGFRAARKLHRVVAIGQPHALAIRAVDLRMKPKIRCEPFCLRGINALAVIADQKCGRRRIAVLIAHAQRDLARRLAIEQHIAIAAKTEILRALPDIE